MGAGDGQPGASSLHLPLVCPAQAQKQNYRQEKKRATKQLFSALTDPSVVIMADSLKVGVLGTPASRRWPRPSQEASLRDGGKSPATWETVLRIHYCKSVSVSGSCPNSQWLRKKGMYPLPVPEAEV